MPIPTPSLESLTWGETEGSLSLILAPQATLGFDRVGRLTGLYENGFYVARGLDGRCLEKKWMWTGDLQARRHIRELTEPERGALRHRVRQLLTQGIQAVPRLAEKGGLHRLRGGREEPLDPVSLQRSLDELKSTMDNRWARDPRRFSRVWRPIGILPPDQYLSLVIQVTEGCAWNQCGFCDFYAAHPFRVRTQAEIDRHTEEAAAFFGPALEGRCSIFLGAANALQAPPPLLLEVAEKLARRFPRLATPQADGVGGLYAFAETVRLGAWTPSDLKALAATGFRRAYVGVETGCDDLRRAMRKPGTASQALHGLEKLKSAGIPLGVIVLLGAGGREAAARHVKSTVTFLARAPLGPGDLVYFSPLWGDSSASPLTTAELESQRNELEHRVPSRGERRALYDIREFLY